ncbi:MAG: response regulator [Deltaproteobacteria bacterium]|nr:response regulator [Deltaproteobacteria bacterium]
MAFDPKNVQILLVEDTAVMRKIEIKTLKSLGFDGIVEAVDGNQAIGILQGDRKVDLIISDWNMPNKDGYELLCWVKGNTATAPIPFLMATGQGGRQGPGEKSRGCRGQRFRGQALQRSGIEKQDRRSPRFGQRWKRTAGSNARAA